MCTYLCKQNIKLMQEASLRPIMFVGTGSDVGKSIVNAAFCRIFKQDGYNPAPFKAQNMSLNSYATPEGYELGRAQAVQAEACCIPCHTDMNPVLLKPTSDKCAQVVLHGRPVGNQTAQEYFLGNNKMRLFEEALGSYNRLAAQYNPIVLEGAGSISEINLRDRDITNMRMALATGAATYLVADINKGGVFASVYGTMQLLPDEERAAIKGIIINKFRGDAALFEDGKKQLEELTGKPVVGILPYFSDIYIDDEDSVSLDRKHRYASAGRINVAVVLLGKMSNFTDFAVLEHHPDVHLYYTGNADELMRADIIIVPGSKNTIADLEELKRTGLSWAIIQAYRADKTVIGICGGYQMLGHLIEDPYGVEGDIPSAHGIGLFMQRTVLEKEKITRQCQFRFMDSDEVCHGYEIHMGETSMVWGKPNPLNVTLDGRPEGFIKEGKYWGTYIHGILDNAVVIDRLLAPYASKRSGASFDFNRFKAEQYDKLASHVRQHVDMDLIYSHLKL